MERISALGVLQGYTAQVRKDAAKYKQILKLFDRTQQRAAQESAFWRIGPSRHDELRARAARRRQRVQRRTTQESALGRAGPCQHSRQNCPARHWSVQRREASPSASDLTDTPEGLGAASVFRNSVKGQVIMCESQESILTHLRPHHHIRWQAGRTFFL